MQEPGGRQIANYPMPFGVIQRDYFGSEEGTLWRHG